MAEWMQRTKLALAALGLAAVALGCSGRAGKPAVDSNSNWLSACEVTADCEGDGTCICGLCTRTCDDDAQCKRVHGSAVCVSPAAAEEQAACAAVVHAADEQVCLASCDSNADCAPHTRCIEHACWPAPSTLRDARDAGADAGAEPGVVSSRPVPDVSTVDAAIDFSTPVRLLPVQTRIDGEGADALVGVWQELEPTHYDHLMVRVEVAPDPAGGFRGTLAFMCPSGLCDPAGPPAPATDPAAGYPPDLDPQAQDLLRINPLPNTPYRILDPRVEQGRFSFYYTNNDLWRDWCALQTPYPYEANGRTELACAPELQSCRDVQNRAASDDPSLTAKELLCCAGGGPCQCDESRCDVNAQAAKHSVDLSVDATTMKGIALIGTDTYGLVLHKMSAGQP